MHDDTLTIPRRFDKRRCENCANCAELSDTHAKCEFGGIIYPRGRHGCYRHAWIDKPNSHRSN